MTPSWYDVLGVEPDATPEEIREAWRAAIADLDPTDRRFKARNQAAEVLLDPTRRAEHDAVLAAEATEDDVDTPAPATAPAATVDLGKAAAPEPVADADEEEPESDVHEDDETDETVDASPARSRGPVTTVVLGVVALALVVATIVSVARVGVRPGGAEQLPDSGEVAAARAAAEAAIVPILSIDYRDLEGMRTRATSYMTSEYADTYEQFVEGLIEGNAETNEVVVSVDVLSSGVVRTGPGRVDVLLLLDRPTSNVSGTTTYQDDATLQMREVDDRWLVACLVSQQSSTCSD